MKYSLLLSLLALFSVPQVYAQEQLKTDSPIYQNSDQQGRTIYSDKPADEFTENIKLPEIRKENIDDKINQLKQLTPPSCGGHGEISCVLGEDSDGSVICLDGYRDAAISFSTFCSKARLKILSLYLRDENSKIYVPDERLPFAQQIVKTKATVLLVSVYNASEIEAQNIDIKLRKRRIEYINGSGKTNIGPYEAEEYLFLTSDLLNITKLKNLTRGMIYLDCKNCR